MRFEVNGQIFQNWHFMETLGNVYYIVANGKANLWFPPCVYIGANLTPPKSTQTNKRMGAKVYSLIYDYLRSIYT